MNLFGTVLTYTAPSSNYRGESAENRTVIQKITKGRHEFAIISPEAIRNAMRETLHILGLPCNRKRLEDEEQLAVEFKGYPDSDEYADDFFMGWLIAAKKKERESIIKELEKQKRDLTRFTFKRDSILRMNMAVALEHYRHNTVFTQSPQDKTPEDVKKHKNDPNSQLLHRETAYTAYQYPFALNLDDCSVKQDWTKTLINAIGELNGVSGNHARSYFEFAPASIVIRLTKRLVAGYDTYGFKIKEDGTHDLSEIIDGILNDDFPGSEFYLGGKVVKDLIDSKDDKLKEELKKKYSALEEKGVNLYSSPQKLLEIVADNAFKG